MFWLGFSIKNYKCSINFRNDRNDGKEYTKIMFEFNGVIYDR